MSLKGKKNEPFVGASNSTDGIRSFFVNEVDSHILPLMGAWPISPSLSVPVELAPCVDCVMGVLFPPCYFLEVQYLAPLNGVL